MTNDSWVQFRTLTEFLCSIYDRSAKHQMMRRALYTGVYRIVFSNKSSRRNTASRKVTPRKNGILTSQRTEPKATWMLALDWFSIPIYYNFIKEESYRTQQSSPGNISPEFLTKELTKEIYPQNSTRMI